MKTHIRNIITKIVGLLLIVIMVMLTINQSVFIHTHKLADGTIIVHAHPYDKSSDSTPEKHHHHKLKDIVFLQHLQLLFWGLLSLFIIPNLLVKRESNPRQKLHLNNLTLHYASNRASPFML